MFLTVFGLFFVILFTLQAILQVIAIVSVSLVHGKHWIQDAVHALIGVTGMIYLLSSYPL